jgi:hypothetical protein
MDPHLAAPSGVEAFVEEVVLLLLLLLWSLGSGDGDDDFRGKDAVRQALGMLGVLEGFGQGLG